MNIFGGSIKTFVGEPEHLEINHKTCSRICKGNCCKHLIIQIPGPNTEEDVDGLRYFLYHKDVNLYVDDEDNWFIDFITECEKLTDNNDCGIYETRPNICKEYPPYGSSCEYNQIISKAYFSDVDSFDKYLKEKGN